MAASGTISNQVVIVLLICFMFVLGYTAFVLGKEDDIRDTVDLAQLVKGLNGPAMPDFPKVTLSQGSRPFMMDLNLRAGSTIKPISTANEKITAKINGNNLTLTLDPFFVGTEELEFIVSTPDHKDPIVKTLPVTVIEYEGAAQNSYTPALPEKNSRDPIDPNLLRHDCLPPYFPEAPLKPNKMKMCHPDWIDGNSFFSKCDSDPTCNSCIQQHHHKKAKTLLDAINKNRADMHNEVVSILNAGGVARNGTVMVQMLNKGYYYHWANFVCSCDANNIPVRNYTLVVVFDDDSYKRATAAGFMVYEPKWIPVNIDEKAASSFALGPHGVIMVFEHMMRNELIHLGYDTMFQDTDIVWRHDPMPWLMKTHPRLDIQVMYDGRTDGVGPINSGFIFTRSNCRTKIYLQTMIDNIVFFLWDRASQPFVNALVHHRKFRQISMRLLDIDLFMNGNRWTPEKPPDNWDELDPLVMHASWTGNHLDKMNKWSQVDQWYLNPQCPLWDPEIFTEQVCTRMKDKLKLDCKSKKKAK